MVLFDLDTQKWNRVHSLRPEQYVDTPYLDVYTVAPGDAVPGMSGERCEGVAYTDGDPGDKHRWTWRTRFPTSFTPNPATRWNIWAQWHAASNTAQAPVVLLVDTYQITPRLMLRVWPGKERYITLGPLVVGHIYDVQADILWGDGGGNIKIFFDGVLVGEDAGPNCYTGDSGTYFKQGFYRGASNLTTSIRHGHAHCETF